MGLSDLSFRWTFGARVLPTGPMSVATSSQTFSAIDVEVPRVWTEWRAHPSTVLEGKGQQTHSIVVLRQDPNAGEKGWVPMSRIRSRCMLRLAYSRTEILVLPPVTRAEHSGMSSKQSHHHSDYAATTAPKTTYPSAAEGVPPLHLQHLNLVHQRRTTALLLQRVAFLAVAEITAAKARLGTKPVAFSPAKGVVLP